MPLRAGGMDSNKVLDALGGAFRSGDALISWGKSDALPHCSEINAARKLRLILNRRIGAIYARFRGLS
jgi:hypothetical protein